MATTPQFTVLASDLAFPEGPVAMADGSVLLVEVQGRSLTRVYPDGRKKRVAVMGGAPSGTAIGPDGRAYICNGGGFKFITDEVGMRVAGHTDEYVGGRIERVDLGTGAVETLYTHSDKAQLAGPNDLVFDRHGGFWFTDIGRVLERETIRGTVCYAKADGTLCREVLHGLWIPNGIGLSPDGSTLYVVETATARLWAWDVTGPGEVARKPWPSPNGGRFVSSAPSPQIYQNYDSLAVDGAGNICVATLVHGGITVFPPDGGPAEHVPLPDTSTTNICFGGPDLQTAYVTLSRSGRLVSFRWPRPGLRLAYGA